MAAVAVNRYPDGGARRGEGGAAPRCALPDALGLILGNGSDELIQIITIGAGEARRDDARPGADVRDVPD